MDKKSADEYDKMLDMADNLTVMLDSTPFELSDEVKEDLSIYLAKNREDVLVALQAKKAKPVPKAITKPKIQAEPKVDTAIEEAKVEEVIVEETITTEPVNETVVDAKEKAVPKKTVRKTKSKTASDIANAPA